jgi:3-hydroxyisobutyrate dehydrogenase-like beta-hydroxyacid dehydrogenase
MEEQGADGADTAAEVAEVADIVITSLPDSEIVENVYLGDGGLIEAADGDSLLVDTSTVKPETMESVADTADAAGIAFVDCAVIGPPPDAADATLTTVVGCDEGSLERVRPVLEAIGNRIDHFDNRGDAMRIKLANNTINYGNWAIAAEMIALVDRMDLDPEHFFDIVDSGSAASPIVAAKAPKAFDGDHEPGFPIDGARKDLRYAREMKDNEDYPAPIAATIGEQFTMASELLDGDVDYSAMIELFEAADNEGDQ